jgi:hypothetical protein
VLPSPTMNVEPQTLAPRMLASHCVEYLAKVVDLVMKSYSLAIAENLAAWKVYSPRPAE